MTRLCLLLFCLLATPGLASSAVQMDVPALARAASDIVHARVASTRSAWTDDHRRLVTFVEVDVLQGWKGQAAGKLTVVQQGGERDGFGQTVAGVATLTVGEELVLFLERQGPLYRVVGLSQGVYRVQSAADGTGSRAVPAGLEGLQLMAPAGKVLSPRTPLPLEELRSAVRREVQRE